ncbi:MAG: hypothetical protein JWP91_144 [Fibrobacteres bacterium]|nr:hypothetical protein [Fibrobacterota bacterium]
MGLKLSPGRFSGGMQPPPAKGPFFIFLLMMPAFILLIILLLVVMQYKQLHSFVSPQPMPLSVIPDSPEAQERARARITDFLGDTARDSATTAVHRPDTLIVSAEEINQLARSSRTLSDMKLDYHLDLEDTLLVARNSLPVEHLRGFLATMARVLRVKGYLNSEMKGYPEFKDGTITIVPTSAVMNGQAAPVSVLGKGKLDVRDWVEDKAVFDRALAHLADVKIRDDHLILIKKR